MLKYYTLCLFTWFVVNVFAQCTFEKRWSYFPYNDISRRIRSVVLSDGGYLLAGVAYLDSIDVVDGSEPNMILIKTDACGKTLWVNDTGYSEDGDPDVALLETDDGQYVMASNNGFSGIRIGKYDTKGHLVKEQWIETSATYTSVKGILKHPSKQGNILVYGSENKPANNSSVPVIVELNQELGIVKWHRIQPGAFLLTGYTSGTLSDIFLAGTNQLRGIVWFKPDIWSMKDTTFWMELDSSFSVTKFTTIGEDSIVKYYWSESGVVLSADGQTLTGGASILNKKDAWPDYKEALIRVDVNGNMKKVVYLDDSISFTWYFKQTSDGGYIKDAGVGLMKLDSSLTIQWIKNTGNAALTSINILEDGGFVGAGSWFYDPYDPEAFARICLVRTDSLGNFIRMGTEEPTSVNQVSMDVFPNPVQGLLNLVLPGMQQCSVGLYDITGKRVYEKVHSGNTGIATDRFADGVYVLRILDTQGGLMFTERILIQK